MLYPTDITQLGSSVICDIDQSSYIIDRMPRTSFRIDENVTRYSCLSCAGSKCMSTRLFMLHSQVGVDLEFDVDLDTGEDETNTEFDYELREEISKNFRVFPYYDTPFKYLSATNKLDHFERSSCRNLSPIPIRAANYLFVHLNGHTVWE